jgi:hypothetical protein
MEHTRQSISPIVVNRNATAFLYYTLMFRMFVAIYVMSSLFRVLRAAALESGASIAWYALTSVTHSPDVEPRLGLNRGEAPRRGLCWPHCPRTKAAQRRWGV